MLLTIQIYRKGQAVEGNSFVCVGDRELLTISSQPAAAGLGQAAMFEFAIA